MCRNIKNLFNFDPPATDEEIKNASLQFVRKLSGFTNPSIGNADTFNHAVDEISVITQKLLQDLVTNAKQKNRDVEMKRMLEKNAQRFGTK
jgi:hypothetical protein